MVRNARVQDTGDLDGPEILLEEKPEEKELTSKDLTRKQLLKYIFEDFFRVSYIVAMMFVDIMVILEVQYYVLLSSNSLVVQILSVFGRPYFLYLLIIIAEIVLIFLQIKLFRRLWPSKRPVDPAE